MTRALHRRANWFAGAGVWLCAAFAFPLYLGMAGAPVSALVAYAALAAGLLLVADILHDPAAYRGTGSVRAQAMPFLIAVMVPATVAFAIGQVLAPLERAIEEEEVCELAGFAAAPESPMDEAGDGFDLTADCAPAAAS